MEPMQLVDAPANVIEAVFAFYEANRNWRDGLPEGDRCNSLSGFKNWSGTVC
jgi:hypothetical protein